MSIEGLSVSATISVMGSAIVAMQENNRWNHHWFHWLAQVGRNASVGGDDDPHRGVVTNDLHTDLPALFPLHADVGGCRAHLQIADQHAVDEGGKRRPPQADLVREGIEFEPEARLQERKRCRACPGLRRAGDGIKRGAAAAAAAESAKEFR